MPEPSLVNQAAGELIAKFGSVEEAEAILGAIADRDKQSRFICYWQPHSYQEKAFDVFKDDTKFLGILGGNRSGKTEVGAAIATAWCLGRDYFKDTPAWAWVSKLPIPAPPNVVWVVGLDYNIIRDVLWTEKLVNGTEHAPFVPMAETKKINEGDRQIFFKNGSVLTCKSADSGWEKFQAAAVDFVWIDEEPEASIYDECFQRTASTGGRILVTLTPLSDINSGVKDAWIYDLYRLSLRGSPDYKFVKFSLLDNPSIPDIEKQRQKEKWLGHSEERARLYGEFVSRTGLVYPMWNRDKHVVEPKRLDRNFLRICSIDPAATGPTAALWIAVDPAGDMFVYREYLEDNLVVSEHAKNIVLATGTDRIDYWLIDPKWGAQRNAESHKTGMQLYRENNVPVRLAPVGADFGLNESREYLQAVLTTGSRHPRCYVFSTLEGFIDQIEHYVWDSIKRGAARGMTKDKPRKGHDDLINAWQYACSMRPRGRRSFVADASFDAQRQAARTNSYFEPMAGEKMDPFQP